MRFLIEIFVVAGLLYLGWEKPFREWAGQTPPPPPITAAPSPTLQVSPAGWMTDPNRHTSLDTDVQNAHPSATKAGSWLFDPSHRSALDPPKHPSPNPH
jgi:hypothetical protein